MPHYRDSTNGEKLSAPVRRLGEGIVTGGWVLDSLAASMRNAGDVVGDFGYWLWRQVDGG